MSDLNRLSKIYFNSNLYTQALIDKINGRYLDQEKLDQLEIGKILKDIVSMVPPKQGGAINEMIPVPGEFFVWQGNRLGVYIVQVTRPRDNFYLTVIVIHEGDLYGDERDILKLGYTFYGTNGSIDEVSDVIVYTSDYW